MPQSYEHIYRDQWMGRKRLDLGQSSPYIQTVSCLDNYPDTDMAETYMKCLARMVAPVMERHGWTVDHFSEFYPAEAIWGLNTGEGHLISVRIRDYGNRALFRNFDDMVQTVCHELCHNSYGDHDGDFMQLWNQLNNEMKSPGGEAAQNLHLMLWSPVQPANHVSISFGGRKVFLRRADWVNNFSNYARKFQHHTGLITFPRTLQACVVARLVQLAKGLDPADDKSLLEIPNYADYWSNECGRLSFWDAHANISRNAFQALDLYLGMYKVGEALGWHNSSKTWLLTRLDRLLRWHARLVNDGSWTIPDLMTPNIVSVYLAQAVRQIWNQSTNQDQDLRGVVLAVVSKVLEICLDDQYWSDQLGFWNFSYDNKEIFSLVESLSELKVALGL